MNTVAVGFIVLVVVMVAIQTNGARRMVRG
jgi:hypothetical protein